MSEQVFSNNHISVTLGARKYSADQHFCLLVSIGNKIDKPLTISAEKFLLKQNGKTCAHLPVEQVLKEIKRRAKFYSSAEKKAHIKRLLSGTNEAFFELQTIYENEIAAGIVFFQTDSLDDVQVCFELRGRQFSFDCEIEERSKMAVMCFLTGLF